MSPKMCCFWLLLAIACSLVPCVTSCKQHIAKIIILQRSLELCNESLPFLPEELASSLKQISFDSGRIELSLNVRRNEVLLRKHIETLKKKSLGLLSTNTFNGLIKILRKTAQLIRIEKVQREGETISPRQIECSLARNIYSMARSIAVCIYHNHDSGEAMCSNFVYSHDIDFHFNKIRGIPRVRSIVFHKDEPLSIGSPFEDADIEHVVNRGSHPITLKRTYTERHGRTTSVTRAMQFGTKVSAAFSFGFSFFGNEARTSFSFETSIQTSTTYMGEITKETTVQREYTFIVAPGESAIISVKQDQLNLRLRYTVVLDFDGIVKNVTGIWEGSANSNIKVSYIPLE